jgi:hypothetical protein
MCRRGRLLMPASLGSGRYLRSTSRSISGQSFLKYSARSSLSRSPSVEKSGCSSFAINRRSASNRLSGFMGRRRSVFSRSSAASARVCHSSRWVMTVLPAFWRRFTLACSSRHSRSSSWMRLFKFAADIGCSTVASLTLGFFGELSRSAGSSQSLPAKQRIMPTVHPDLVEIAFLDEPGHERRGSIGTDNELTFDNLSVNARQHHRYPEKIVIGGRGALCIPSPCSQVSYSVEEHGFCGQTVAVAVSIEFFNRLTDATDMPASRATARTPLPDANSRSALSIWALAIGGRPNLIFRLRAVA